MCVIYIYIYNLHTHNNIHTHTHTHTQRAPASSYSMSSRWGLADRGLQVLLYLLLRQYLYFCTCKPTISSTFIASIGSGAPTKRQYLYFCTSKASTFVSVKQSKVDSTFRVEISKLARIT